MGLGSKVRKFSVFNRSGDILWNWCALKCFIYCLLNQWYIFLILFLAFFWISFLLRSYGCFTVCEGLVFFLFFYLGVFWVQYVIYQHFFPLTCVLLIYFYMSLSWSIFCQKYMIYGQNTDFFGAVAFVKILCAFNF